MSEKSIVHSREFMKYKTVVLEVLQRSTWNKFAGYFVNRFKDYSRYRGGQTRLMTALKKIKKKFVSSNIEDESYKFNFLKKLLNTQLTLVRAEGFEKE